MKFFVLGVLFAALPAQAAIIDQFDCIMKFTGNPGWISFETRDEVNLPRMPQQNSPAPQVTITHAQGGGEMSVRGESKQFTVSYALSYSHAVERDATQHITRAAQSSVCLGVGFSEGNEAWMSACGTPVVEDPADPNYPFNVWIATPVNGETPALRMNGETHAFGDVKDAGKFDIECRFLRTLN